MSDAPAPSVVGYTATITRQAEVEVVDPYAFITYVPVPVGEEMEIAIATEGYEYEQVTYEWQRSDDGETWGTVAGEEEDVYAFTLTQADVGTYVRAIVRGATTGYVTGSLEIEEEEE